MAAIGQSDSPPSKTTPESLRVAFQNPHGHPDTVGNPDSVPAIARSTEKKNSPRVIWQPRKPVRQCEQKYWRIDRINRLSQSSYMACVESTRVRLHHTV
jgi:hypothetical protein